jgi:hypothetical protein
MFNSFLAADFFVNLCSEKNQKYITINKKYIL